MALTARVTRLERTARARPPAPCAVCGAPAGWHPGMLVRNEEGVELLPKCGRCGFALDDQARALCPVPPGGGQKVLILDELPPV